MESVKEMFYFKLNVATFFRIFKKHVEASFLGLYTCRGEEEFDRLCGRIVSALAFRHLYFRGAAEPAEGVKNDMELSIVGRATALGYFPRYDLRASFAFVWEYMREVLNFEFLTLTLVGDFEATTAKLLAKLRGERFPPKE